MSTPSADCSSDVQFWSFDLLTALGACERSVRKPFGDGRLPRRLDTGVGEWDLGDWIDPAGDVEGDRERLVRLRDLVGGVNAWLGLGLAKEFLEGELQAGPVIRLGEWALDMCVGASDGAAGGSPKPKVRGEGRAAKGNEMVEDGCWVSGWAMT